MWGRFISATQPDDIVIVFPMLLLALMFVITGCGGGGDKGVQVSMLVGNDSRNEAGSGNVPHITELEAELARALSELGITDPAKVPATAPSGTDNTVFDLSARVIDPDGEGGNPPTGVQLTWTERMLGDYDANGEVGSADLIPISQHWEEIAEYDDSSLHGGLKWWPVGDPEDGSTGTANWVKARVDGDGNTEIRGSDVVTIAQHWHERLDGYRVYAQAPGESSFSLIETLPHPSGAHLDAPVRYSFDADIAGTGVYRYYVAPVDDADTEGVASGAVSINVETGSVNHEPVAVLKVSPGFAGAPAEITLDASNSYDVDGDSLSFAWDFDADGVTDWVNTGAPPAESSTGLADSITAGAVPGLVMARYTRGSAEWYYPRVTAVDTEGAESLPASAKLGLSGWVNTVLNESVDDYLISVYPSLIDIDPKTGRKVLVASSTLPPLNGEEYRRSLFYSVENMDGTWTTEELPMSVLTGDINESIQLRDVVWDEYLEPIILLQYSDGNNHWVWAAQRSTIGTWDARKRFPDIDPEYFDYAGIYWPGTSIPGQFICLLSEALNDKSDIYGYTPHIAFNILMYDHGEWSIEDTGYDTADTGIFFGRSSGYSPDNLLCYFDIEGDITDGPWAARWEDGALGEPFRIDDGTITFGDPTYCQAAILGEDGTRYTIWDETQGLKSVYWLLINTPTEFISFNLSELGEQIGYSTGRTSGLYAQNDRIGLFQYVSEKETDTRMYQHVYLENTKWIREAFQSPYPDLDDLPHLHDTAITATGEQVALLAIRVPRAYYGFESMMFTAERVDPRL